MSAVPGIIDTQAVAPGFYKGSGASNSGPHACVPAPLSIKQSPQLIVHIEQKLGQRAVASPEKIPGACLPLIWLLRVSGCSTWEQRHLASQKNQSVDKGLWSAY